MNISFTPYDIFSYTIPGALYLYLIDLIYKTFGGTQDLLGTLENDWLNLGIFIFSAYVVGLLFSTVEYNLWSKPILGDPENNRLKFIKDRYPHLISFSPQDWSLLHSIINTRNSYAAKQTSNLKSVMIMCRNLSFGFLLLSIFSIYEILSTGYTLQANLMVIGSGLLSFVALRAAKLFDHYFYDSIFQIALNYGSSVEEVLAWEDQPKRKEYQIQQLNITNRK